MIRIRASTADAAGIFTLDRACPGERYSRVRAARRRALVLHTSGTTARPKLVPLTQANLAASARNIAASLGLDASDRCLNVMPLFHIHGFVGALLSTMVSGGEYRRAHRDFRRRAFLTGCDEFAPTWYTAVPTMHQAVLARGDREPCAGSKQPVRFIRSVPRRFPPI